jgi:hypothetical protein
MSKLPLNRIVAFLGPYIAILSGAVVDWLFVHLHFLTNWHTNQSSITKWLTQALVFGLTSGLVWLGQQSWLKGWIAWESKNVVPVIKQISDQAESKPPDTPKS